MTQSARTLVDLSQPLYEGMPHATTIPEPRFDVVRSMDEHGLRCMQLTLPTHCGTHLDAPSHFLADGATLDAIAPDTLIGPAVCVEVEAAADREIAAEDIERAAARDKAEIRPGDALLLRTGWDARYGSADYYHHPYLSEAAAAWIARSGVRMVGVDTVTPEMTGALRPPGYPCPVHRTLLGAGVLILENLDLRAAAGRRCELFVGVLRVAGADGAPARVLARLE